MTADGLATAVFVLGPEKGYALCQKLKGVECLIVDKEGKITPFPRFERPPLSHPLINPISLGGRFSCPSTFRSGTIIMVAVP